MGRIRSLKPEFFRSPTMARLSIPARLTFAGMWTEADDHGVGQAEPRLLKGALWALDDEITPEVVAAHLAEMVDPTDPCIQLYEVDGVAYYFCLNWTKHQSAAFRRGDRKYPPPPRVKRARDRVQPALDGMQDAPEGVLEQGTGNREQGGEQGLAARAPRARDLLFDAVAEECGIDPGALTRGARGSLNAALKDLRAVEATPEQVHRRAAEYRTRYRDADLTPTALAKHWPRLNGDSSTLSGGKGAIARGVHRLLGAES